ALVARPLTPCPHASELVFVYQVNPREVPESVRPSAPASGGAESEDPGLSCSPTRFHIVGITNPSSGPSFTRRAAAVQKNSSPRCALRSAPHCRGVGTAGTTDPRGCSADDRDEPGSISRAGSRRGRPGGR